MIGMDTVSIKRKWQMLNRITLFVFDHTSVSTPLLIYLCVCVSVFYLSAFNLFVECLFFSCFCVCLFLACLFVCLFFLFCVCFNFFFLCICFKLLGCVSLVTCFCVCLFLNCLFVCKSYSHL